MDNYHFDITSDGPVEPAMAIAFAEHRASVWRRQAVAYLIHPVAGMVFFWHPKLDIEGLSLVHFPFRVGAAEAASFATSWLREVQYPEEPDHDGHNNKAWRVYNNDWGRVGDMTYSFAAVKPEWAMFGK